STNSGTLTVVAGDPTDLRVETAANGSGTVVPAQNVTAGSSDRKSAVKGDSYGNFVASTDGSWSLASPSGGVVAADLAPAVDNKSAVFTGHKVGTAQMRVTKIGLSSTNSGTLTVVAGDPSDLRVETAANGSGTVVPAQNVTAGS